MQSKFKPRLNNFVSFIGLIILLFVFGLGCTKKDDSKEPTPEAYQMYSQLNNEREVEQVKKNADKGDLIAIKCLAHHYLLIENKDKAIYWARKGADKGDPETLFELYLALHLSNDPALRKEGFDALIKAAERNDVQAQVFLASAYKDGIEIGKDLKAAEYWYEKAAYSGTQEAMISLIDLLIKRKPDVDTLVVAYGWTIILYERNPSEIAANLEEGFKYKSNILSNVNNKEEFVARADGWAKINGAKIPTIDPRTVSVDPCITWQERNRKDRNRRRGKP
jgi:TPR repeat protein